MKPHVLIVEDNTGWQQRLQECIEELDPNICVEIAGTREDAVAAIHHTFFPLIVLDFRLDEDDHDLGEDLLKLAVAKFVRELKQHANSQDSNIIVVSENVNDANMHETLGLYHVRRFFRKTEFRERREEFKARVRSEILDALLKRAERRYSERYYLSVRFNDEWLIGSSYRGPEVSADSSLMSRTKLDVKSLKEQTDELGLSVEASDPDLWRKNARKIGQKIYKNLIRQEEVSRHLHHVQVLARETGGLWIEFKGPVTGLGVPFELIREDGQNLCMTCILTRQVQGYNKEGGSGRAFYRNNVPFHRFIKKISEDNVPLRILIVGSNQGDLRLAEEEVKALTEVMERSLKTVGINHTIHTIKGQKATYERVVSALQNGRYHIFHYAGHGAHNAFTPEKSGVALSSGKGNEGWMTAAQLNTALTSLGAANLQMVFLNSCFSAAVSDQPGYGDFLGIFDALVRADVPHVLGYRWGVVDEAAIEFAKAFYQHLWITFSPGEALLEARRAAAINGDRDDDIWASPVMVVQNIRD